MALLAHNEWLENIAGGRSHRSYAEKVIRNKPATAQGRVLGRRGAKYEEPHHARSASAVCNTLFPVHATRASSRVLRRRRHPQVSAEAGSGYASTSGVHHRRDRAPEGDLPRGVCDWSQPGVNQRPLLDTWLAYPRPGNAVSLEETLHRGRD